MPKGRFDDEIWDEHRWEAQLNEIERESEQLRKFIASDSSENNPRWITLLKENTDKLDAVDAFIEEELQIEEAYFPEDEEWDDDFDELDEEDEYFDSYDEFDDFDEGEEWKELSEDFARSENGSIENLNVYNQARELSVHVLQWVEGIHPKLIDSACSTFVSNVLKMGAKLAGGYSFGFELEYLGANIACTKKALHAANDALKLLENNLKRASFLNRSQYLLLHENLFELRNDIGIYVQDLREQFYFGFE